MTITCNVHSCTPKAIFSLIEGTGTQKEFEDFVTSFLKEHTASNAKLAHNKTIQDILVPKGGKFMAVIQEDTYSD